MLRFIVLFAVFHLSYGNHIVVVGPTTGNATPRDLVPSKTFAYEVVEIRHAYHRSLTSLMIQQLGPAAPVLFWRK